MIKNVLQVIPDFGLAGAETMCESLCYELHDSDTYNVYVASLYTIHSPITKRLEERGIKIHYLGKSGGLDIKIVKKLYKVMKDLHIDIVHTHRYVLQYVIPAAILSGVKIRVHTVHNIAEKELDSSRQKLAFFFYKFCNVTPVSISPIVQQSVMKRYGLKEEQTPIVLNGTDLSRCITKKNYQAHEPFRFVHIGRFSEQKNHGSIIEAASILKSRCYKFTINLIGGAGNEEERKQEVKQKGLEDIIIFSGLQSNVYPFLSESDCFILPSLYEGMPVSLVESMGCGLPIIASAVGGVPDMITDEESGLLINPNSKELYHAMKKMMDGSESYRESLGKKALAKSRLFSAENMRDGYIKIYSSKNVNTL